MDEGTSQHEEGSVSELIKGGPGSGPHKTKAEIAKLMRARSDVTDKRAIRSGKVADHRVAEQDARSSANAHSAAQQHTDASAMNVRAQMHAKRQGN